MKRSCNGTSAELREASGLLKSLRFIVRPIDYVDLSGEQLEETVFEVLAQNSRPSIKRLGLMWLKRAF